MNQNRFRSAVAYWRSIRIDPKMELVEQFCRPGVHQRLVDDARRSAYLAGLVPDLAIAMPLSWLPLIADYVRYRQAESLPIRF